MAAAGRYILLMSDNSDPANVEFSRTGQWWVAVIVLAFLSCYPLGWMDTATELAPDHSGVLGAGFVLAILVAIGGSVILWSATKSWPTGNRVGFTVAAALFTILAITMVFMPASEIVEGWIDFPPSETTTYQNALIQISRAYQTHGKGRSLNVQTMPIWSNIKVTQKDYDFMLKHRSPEDHGQDEDEITSNGYFCVKGDVQKAGNAIRIMNAGHPGLAPGSIIICPPDFEQHPHI